MYKAIFKCTLCGHTHEVENTDLWRIVMQINELENQMHSTPLKCNQCFKMGPIQATVYRTDYNVAVFEKIIMNDKFLPSENSNKPSKNPKLDNPCIVCNATGEIEVKHYGQKKDTKKGVFNEKCPVCSGRGYIK